MTDLEETTTDTDEVDVDVTRPDHVVITTQLLTSDAFEVKSGDGVSVAVPEPLWTVFVTDVRKLARDVKLMSNLATWAGELLENGAQNADTAPAWAVERYNHLCRLMLSYMQPAWADEANQFIATAAADEALGTFALKAGQSVAWVESLAEGALLLANQRQQSISFPTAFLQALRSAGTAAATHGMFPQLGSGSADDPHIKPGQYL